MTEDDKQASLEKQLDAYPVSLDPEQIAEVLGVSRRTVDKLLDAGKIEYFVLDPDAERKQKRVTKAELIGYMLKNYIS